MYWNIKVVILIALLSLGILKAVSLPMGILKAAGLLCGPAVTWLTLSEIFTLNISFRDFPGKLKSVGRTAAAETAAVAAVETDQKQ